MLRVVPQISSQILRPPLDLVELRVDAPVVVEQNSEVAVLSCYWNAMQLGILSNPVMTSHRKYSTLFWVDAQVIFFRYLVQLVEKRLEVCVVHTQHKVVSVEFVPEFEVLAPLTQLFNYLLHVNIEECWADRRALMHSVLEVEPPVSTFEIEC